MDVTDHMDTSIKALMQHESQMNGRPEAEITERMRDWRRQRAVGKGMQYAEAFRRFSFNR
jgi:LmbE family N-acetylglucosaminyl deacetylase